MSKFRVYPYQLRAGDELTTPGSKIMPPLTYRIESIAKDAVFNSTRRRMEFRAVCVWTDTGAYFTSFVPESGLLTIAHKKVG